MTKDQIEEAMRLAAWVAQAAFEAGKGTQDSSDARNARAAIRAHLEGCGGVPEGWRDIATAPKDGTEVLVNDTSGIGSSVVVAKYFAGDEWSGWIYDDDILTDCNPLGPQPTHYMPLPPAPSAAMAKEPQS